MAEYFLIVDDEADANGAATILRSVWMRVEIAASVSSACERIIATGPQDDLVVIVGERMLNDSLRNALSSRPETILIVATDVQASGDADTKNTLVAGKPYGKELVEHTEEAVSHLRMNRILQHVVSILITEPDGSRPDELVAAGSGCLVQLPSQQVILTAGHVTAAMQRAGVRTYIGGNGPPCEITGWPVIGADHAVDIATIRLPDEFDPAVIKSKLYVPSSWPPTRAIVGNAAIMVGFPSEHRTRGPNGELVSHGALFSDLVSSSSTRHFIFAPADVDRKFSTMAAQHQSIDDTGGMSGCPVFVSGYHEKAQLRGVLHEGGRGANAAFFACHADFVRSDGTIDDDLMR